MKERKNNPDKIGFVKFWGWQTKIIFAAIEATMITIPPKLASFTL